MLILEYPQAQHCQICTYFFFANSQIGIYEESERALGAHESDSMVVHVQQSLDDINKSCDPSKTSGYSRPSASP